MTTRAKALVEGSSGNGVILDSVEIKDSLPRTSCCWEMVASAVQVLSSGVITRITWSSAAWDTYPGGITDLVNERITAPLDGKYYVAFNTKIQFSSQRVKVLWYVNGVSTSVTHFYNWTGTNDPWGMCSTILDLSAGDTVDVRAQVFTLMALGSATFYEQSRFTGFFIG